LAGVFSTILLPEEAELAGIYLIADAQ